jgi:hypothetical protein
MRFHLDRALGILALLVSAVALALILGHLFAP